ncbi:MAG TPA: hypothetical protein VHT96_16180 [Clostridia bacterium]|nr:hypothetical protein [Clostridia bacterium]
MQSEKAESAGAFPAVTLEEPAKAQINTYKVKRGSIQNKVVGWGAFLTPATWDLHFRTSGTFKSTYVSYLQKISVGDLVAELDTESLKRQLERARIAQERAKLEYERLKTENELNGGGGKYSIKKAEIDLELAKMDVEDLTSTINLSALKSEVAGVVTSICTFSPGSTVNQEDEIVRIADKSKMLLVSKSNSGTESLKVGTAVEVSYKGKVYNGEVVKLPTDTLSEEKDYMANAIHIKVADLPEDQVSLNDAATFSLILASASDTLLVRKQDIFTAEGKSFVNVYKDGVIKEREIKTGIVSSDSGDIEVVDGLEEGEDIIVR